MKKPALCILMFLFVLLFSGCKDLPPAEINPHIDSSFKAKMGELDLKGLIIYTEDKEMYLDISTPDELYGLSYSWTDTFTVGYRGLNAVTESDYLPPSSFAQAIKNTLDDIILSKPDLVIDAKGTFTATGKSKSGRYEVFTDREGNVAKINLPEADITMVIN